MGRPRRPGRGRRQRRLPRVPDRAHPADARGARRGDPPQREIADAAFELQSEIDRGDRVVVGVNAYTEGDDATTPILHIDPALERKQVGRLQAVRARRAAGEVEAALAALRASAAGERNLMEDLLACARVRASEGEIIESLQRVWGRYTEAPVF